MQQKKSLGFGARGWLLIISQAIAFLAFTAFTNYPMNLLASSGFYGGWTGNPEAGEITGTALVSTIYTIAAVVCVVIQLILSRFMGKIKSIKPFLVTMGIIGLAIAAFITFYPPTMNPQGDVLWLILYGIECVTIVMYATFAFGVIIGQWFPRRKGTVMGIATLIFPIANGLIGFVANGLFAMDFEAEGGPVPQLIEYAMSGGFAGKNTMVGAMLPFLIVCVIGFLIAVIFVKDYPEQVGAYRDNDKSITPEVAQKMMEQEIEARRTTVWTTGHTMANRDFWFITIPAGFLLMFAVGAMTQTQPIFQMVGLGDSYQGIMFGICAAGLIGSYVLGIIDTKIGTKKSMIMATALMVISGILGIIGVAAHVGALVVVAFIILGLFMGASSNYTVSAAAQYWRREDFSSVFACLNPIANLLQAFGPMIIANLLFGAAGLNGVFITCAIAGAVSVVLMILFSAKHVKETDDKYRTAAGKPLDDELAHRL
ncbi:MAG: MFS transporter [Parasporobacterium sp.]|nr:MFS transporter [Parasporobacterium sp.]